MESHRLQLFEHGQHVIDIFQQGMLGEFKRQTLRSGHLDYGLSAYFYADALNPPGSEWYLLMVKTTLPAIPPFPSFPNLVIIQKCRRALPQRTRPCRMTSQSRSLSASASCGPWKRVAGPGQGRLTPRQMGYALKKYNIDIKCF